MAILLTAIHYIVCIFLIIVVLLQSGKAADLAGAFGGMGSQTVFGPRGSATVLSKATTIAAVLFMVTSLALSITATRGKGGSSLLDKAKRRRRSSRRLRRRQRTVPLTVTADQPRRLEGNAANGRPSPVAAGAAKSRLHSRRWRNWQTH